MQNPEKNIPQFHLFKHDLKTAFEVEKHIALQRSDGNLDYDMLVMV